MPMPSIFKYFLTVGSALLGLLLVTSYLLQDPAPAQVAPTVQPKAAAVKVDSQASRMERWRAEQAAADAARKEEAARVAAQAAEPEPNATQPTTGATPAQTADASLTAADHPAAEQPKAKSHKTARAEKARSRRLARAAARDHVASNQQDDYYYGQRQGFGFGQRQASTPAYAYAPQQGFGPFGGGWGRGW